MAFAVPILKKEYDLYRVGAGNRSRGTSESSTNSTTIPIKGRSKSAGSSLSTSPGSDLGMATCTSPSRHPAGRISLPSSRSSGTFIQAETCKSPTKGGSMESLNKFQTRLINRLKRTLKIGHSEEIMSDEEKKSEDTSKS